MHLGLTAPVDKMSCSIRKTHMAAYIMCNHKLTYPSSSSMKVYFSVIHMVEMSVH